MRDDDRSRWAEQDDVPKPDAAEEGAPAMSETADDLDDLERASENVLDGWPEPVDEPLSSEDALGAVAPEPALTAGGPGRVLTAALAEHVELASEASEEEQSELAPAEPAPPEPEPPEPELGLISSEHAPGDLVVPPDVPVLEGIPRGERRAVGIVVGRFNGHVTTRMLERALDELRACGVSHETITVMPVPGAFELPLAAMALAKTRRFACVVALGCVIRGDTPHFDYISSETASGLQLAAIETGVPVAFGVLTLDRADQAEARIDKGAEAVRTALEMADLFANLRAAATR